MKKRLIWLMLMLSALIFPNLGRFNLAQAQSKATYSCIQHNGLPTTVVDTPRGRILLIIWKSKAFGEWTPEKRCQTVTERFQKFANEGKLIHISSGIMNRQKVLCVSSKRGECLPNGLLLTLEPKDNPQQVMRQIFEEAAKVGAIPITRGQTVFNLDSYLKNKAPIMENSEVRENPEENQ